MYEILENKYGSGKSTFIPRVKTMDAIDKVRDQEISDGNYAAYLYYAVEKSYVYTNYEKYSYINLHDGFSTYEEVKTFIETLIQKDKDNELIETIVHKLD